MWFYSVIFPFFTPYIFSIFKAIALKFLDVYHKNLSIFNENVLNLSNAQFIFVCLKRNEMGFVYTLIYFLSTNQNFLYKRWFHSCCFRKEFLFFTLTKFLDKNLCISHRNLKKNVHYRHKNVLLQNSNCRKQNFYQL